MFMFEYIGEKKEGGGKARREEEGGREKGEWKEEEQ